MSTLCVVSDFGKKTIGGVRLEIVLNLGEINKQQDMRASVREVSKIRFSVLCVSLEFCAMHVFCKFFYFLLK